MTGLHETVRTLRPKEMQKVGDEKQYCPKVKKIANVRGQQESLAQKTTSTIRGNTMPVTMFSEQSVHLDKIESQKSIQRGIIGKGNYICKYM